MRLKEFVNLIFLFLLAHFFLFSLTIECTADGEQMNLLNHSLIDRDALSASVLSNEKTKKRKRVVSSMNVSKVWLAPRVKVFTADVNDKLKHCYRGGPMEMTAIRGGRGYCRTTSDFDSINGAFLTERKKDTIKEVCEKYIIPTFGKHFLFRQVNKTLARNNLKSDSICGKFNFHQNPGIHNVKDAEILFYVSATPMNDSERHLHLWTHLCPTQKDEPLVIVANVNPEQIYQSIRSKSVDVIKRTFNAHTCEDGLRIVEHTENGFDADKSLCVKFDCEESKSQDKTVYYKNSDSTWEICTDENGKPLKSLINRIPCPSWYELCSGVMNNEITQTNTWTPTLTFTSTITATQTVSVTPRVITKTVSLYIDESPNQMEEINDTTPPITTEEPQEKSKEVTPKVDSDDTDNDSNVVFIDHYIFLFDYDI